MNTDLLGICAGTLTTVSFIPQLIRVWSTKSAKDISWGMLFIFCAGLTLWIWYGISIRAVPVIAANSVTFFFVLILITLKIRYT